MVIIAIIRLSVYNVIMNQKGWMIMDYISASEAAKQWGISERRVQKLCEEDRIPNVLKFSRMWLIPKAAEKPTDKRYTKGKVCDE